MNEYLPAVLITLGVAALAVVLIALGWKGRLRRQADVPAPAAVPASLSEPHIAEDGQYVCTTTAGDWLDRVAVHGLGAKSNATLAVHAEGVLYDRSGAPALFIPTADLISVRRESGMAGKFVEKDGLIVVEWRLGTHTLDTGFRTRRAEASTAVVNALKDVMAADSHKTSPQHAEEKDTK